jgi:hypothetical protein
VNQAPHQADYACTARAILAIKSQVERAGTFAEAVAGLFAQGYDQGHLRGILRPPAEGDLHLHSNHSDGNLPPRKLVWAARLIGLKAIAVADHDGISGIAEALSEGARQGVIVLPACELSTDRPGCEILLYMPDADAWLSFASGAASSFLRAELEVIQRETHERTLAVIPDVNRFLQQHGTPTSDFITGEELSDWYSGQEPFYYGTLAVLGLKRLSAASRGELGIHDPREFNTRVLQPALKKQPRHGRARTVAEALALADRIRAAGVGVVSVLAHPRELETKGKMDRAEIKPFVAGLVAVGLDGIEVACARDEAADVAHWNSIADELDKAGPRGPLVRCSFSSDFHVLNPGRAHGEITLGYGLLDEDHPNGNLQPQGTIEALLSQIESRAREPQS